MPVDVLVPPLSQTMDSLVLIEWLKKPGDPVKKGETLFTVETDKATLEVESPATGVLESVYANPGEEIKIRSVVGMIREPGETPEPQAAQQSLPPERAERIFASPRARKLIQAEGLALQELNGTGSGPMNMIVERDVVAYLTQKQASPRATPVARRMATAEGVDLTAVQPAKAHVITKADIETVLKANHDQAGSTIQQPSLQPGDMVPGRKEKLSPTRRTIARRMLASHQGTAPVTYMRDVDATRLVKLRKQLMVSLPAEQLRPTYTDILIKIACHTLAKHPEFNATLEGEEFSIYSQVDIALAVDMNRGLIAPVIRDAGNMGVYELAQRRTQLLERAKSGALTPEELSGGTFTLSNLGALGIDYFTPILNAPQVAILGIGRIREIPAAHKGKIKIRSILGLALTCDHRVIDGGPAAHFLDDIAGLIENPGLIWA